jgi:hypothetical protein
LRKCRPHDTPRMKPSVPGPAASFFAVHQGGSFHSGNAVPKYRIVKWSPVLPEQRMRTTDDLFTDIETAEIVKRHFEKVLPYRRFAVEKIETDGESSPDSD